jgi:hypothetical protein
MRWLEKPLFIWLLPSRLCKLEGEKEKRVLALKKKVSDQGEQGVHLERLQKRGPDQDASERIDAHFDGYAQANGSPPGSGSREKSPDWPIALDRSFSGLI